MSTTAIETAAEWQDKAAKSPGHDIACATSLARALRDVEARLAAVERATAPAPVGWLASRARLDADGTAAPKTRLVGHASGAERVGSAITTNATHYADEHGAYVPLGAAPLPAAPDGGEGRGWAVAFTDDGGSTSIYWNGREWAPDIHGALPHRSEADARDWLAASSLRPRDARYAVVRLPASPAPSDPTTVRELRAEVERLTRERSEKRAADATDESAARTVLRLLRGELGCPDGESITMYARGIVATLTADRTRMASVNADLAAQRDRLGETLRLLRREAEVVLRCGTDDPYIRGMQNAARTTLAILDRPIKET